MIPALWIGSDMTEGRGDERSHFATPDPAHVRDEEDAEWIRNWQNRPRGAHVTVWPTDTRHSGHRRPFVYKGGESGKWWVDDSGVNPAAWLPDEDAWDQAPFDRWEDALAYALGQVAAHASTPMPSDP